MSGMWVAVTAEYDGATFSHRASIDGYFPARHQALRDYNRLLNEAGRCVRSGFAGWLPVQKPSERPGAPLSSYEKLRAIEKIVTHQSEARTLELDAIRAVLDR